MGDLSRLYNNALIEQLFYSGCNRLAAVAWRAHALRLVPIEDTGPSLPCRMVFEGRVNLVVA